MCYMCIMSMCLSMYFVIPCVCPFYTSKKGTWFFPVSGKEIWHFFNLLSRKLNLVLSHSKRSRSKNWNGDFWLKRITIIEINSNLISNVPIPKLFESNVVSDDSTRTNFYFRLIPHDIQFSWAQGTNPYISCSTLWSFPIRYKLKIQLC